MYVKSDIIKGSFVFCQLFKTADLDIHVEKLAFICGENTTDQ
jgi:hypothetical protein